MGTTDKEGMEHKPVVHDTDNPMYPFIATCTCGWQGLAKTEAQADYYRRSHESQSLWLQATRGLQRGH